MLVKTRFPGQGVPVSLCLFLCTSAALATNGISVQAINPDSLGSLVHSQSFLVSTRAQEIQSRLNPSAADVVHVQDGAAVSTRVLIKVRSSRTLSDDAFVSVLQSVDGVLAPTFNTPARDVAIAEKLGFDRMFVVLVPRGTNIDLLVSRLAALNDVVEWAEPDRLGSLSTVQQVGEPLFESQWAHRNTGQNVNGATGTAGQDIATVAAWTVLPPMQPVIVALVDSGLSQSHPEFAGLVVDGRNFLPTPPNALWDDDTIESHGTQCGGILAAIGNNNLGIAGMAPNAKFLVCKVANGTAASAYAVANAINWSVASDAHIISMSLSFTSLTPNAYNTLQAAVVSALSSGVLLVGATGNSPGTSIGPPAVWSGVIAVGACDNRGQAFAGETTGPEMDVSAPGVDIMTTYDTASNQNGYGFATGTSMAVPHVSGLAAMIWGINPSLTASSVRAIIESTVDDLGPPGRDTMYGLGRINAYRAVLAARDSLYCTADVDYSGANSVQDLFTFLEFFFGQDVRADYDRNGVITVNDVFAFLSDWFGGCP